MLRQNSYLMLPRQHGMLRHHAAAVRNLQPTAIATDFHRLPDQAERDRVAIRFEADEIVLGDQPRMTRLVLEPRLRASRHQEGLLLREAINRPLVRRAVDADIGHRRHPRGELLVEILIVTERPAREKIAAEVFHAGFHLTFGLGPIRLAESWLEAPIIGERFEGRIPVRATIRVRPTDGARTIIEMLARMPAEVLEGALVGFEKGRERLVEAGQIEAAARIP